ncbi:unnamed protein product, partial [marine sediment metagenome]
MPFVWVIETFDALEFVDELPAKRHELKYTSGPSTFSSWYPLPEIPEIMQ